MNNMRQLALADWEDMYIGDFEESAYIPLNVLETLIAKVSEADINLEDPDDVDRLEEIVGKTLEKVRDFHSWLEGFDGSGDLNIGIDLILKWFQKNPDTESYSLLFNWFTEFCECDQETAYSALWQSGKDGSVLVGAWIVREELRDFADWLDGEGYTQDEFPHLHYIDIDGYQG